MLRDLPYLFQNPCGIDVNDKSSPRSLARSECRDNTVNVLGGGNDERDVLLLTDDLDYLFFDRRFIGEQVIAPMHHCPFKEHEVDVANWVLHQMLEELSLAA